MLLLLSDPLVQVFQFVKRALDVLARGLQLRQVHQGSRAGEPPPGPPGNRHRHLEISQKFHGGRRRGRTRLFLYF